MHTQIDRPTERTTAGYKNVRWSPPSYIARFCSVMSFMCLSSLVFSAELYVDNGGGSGAYETGEQAYIFANPSDAILAEEANAEPASSSPMRRIFDRWVGEVEFLEDPYSPRTSIVMPASDVSVSAQFKDASPWVTPSVLTYFPPNHRGVIFLFHGTDGCTWCLAKNPLAELFIRDAVERGYGVVIPEKRRRDKPTWDTDIDPQSNVDMQRISFIRQDLIGRGQLLDSDPVYLVGVSAGGSFASLFDEAAQQQLDFPVSSMVLMLSPGNVGTMTESLVPTLLAFTENDTIVDLNTGVTAHHILIKRGVAAQMVIASPMPIDPNYFWSIDGLTAHDSQAIVSAFAEAGVIDTVGFLVENPRHSNWDTFVPAPHNAPNILADMRDLMLQAYAEHAIIDTFNHRIFSFLESPSARVDLVPEVSQFTPSSGAPGTAVTLSGKFFVDIESVDFNGVEAVFIHVRGDEITAFVPAGVSPGPITVSNPAGTAVTASEFGVPASSELKVTSVSTKRATRGSIVTITGDNLGQTYEVMLGTEASASFTVVSDEELEFEVPANAPRYSLIRIYTPNGSIVAGTLFIH